MTTLLSHAQSPNTPALVASAAWAAAHAALNSGTIEFDYTFGVAISNSHYASFARALLNGSDNGGLWLEFGELKLYNQSGSVFGRSMSGTAAGAVARIKIILAAGTNASSLTITQISGTVGGTGTINFTTSGTYYTTANTLGIGGYSGNNQWDIEGQIGPLTDGALPEGNAAITLGTLTTSATAAADVSGAAAITLGALTTSADGGEPISGGAITLGALTTSATGDIEHQCDAAITLGTLTAGGTATGPVVWSVGAATVKQRYNNSGPSTGTLVTDAVVTTTGSVLIAFIARGRWDSAGSPEGPTDSQGNTWTQVSPGPSPYATYPDSKFGVWWCVNNAGHASHTVSATWGPYGTGDPGNPGDEVTVGMFELLTSGQLVMIDSATHVERATPTTTVTGTAVTPTGPSITVAVLGGNGPVGQSHAFARTAQAIADGWTVVTGAVADGDPDPAGYIQDWPAVLIDQTGSKTGQAQNIGATGTSSEGAQVFQFVLQSAAGILAVGAPTLGAMTVAGDGAVPVVGDSAITLGTLTTSATAAADVSGAAAITLGALTTSADGVAEDLGDAAIVLGALTSSATGAAEEIGAAAIALGTLTTSATADADISGAAAITLGALIASGDGVAEEIGAAAITLGALTASGSSATEVTADATITLGALTVQGSTIDAAEGDAAITLGALTTQGTTIDPVVGDAAIMLGVLTVVGGTMDPLLGDATFTLGMLITSGGNAPVIVGVVSATIARADHAWSATIVRRSELGAIITRIP